MDLSVLRVWDGTRQMYSQLLNSNSRKLQVFLFFVFSMAKHSLELLQGNIL